MRTVTPNSSAAVDIRRVTIESASPDTGEVMVRDTNGAEFTLLGSTRPKGTGFPVDGELWLAQKIGQMWTLRTQIGALAPPVITGGVTEGSPQAATLDALDAIGLIRNQTTPSIGGGGLDESDVRAIVATIPLDVLADALGNIAMGGYKITGLGTPTAPTDAATKAFVDAGDAASRTYTDTQLAALAASGEVAYTHIQSSSSSLWDVVHGLPFVPSVTVVDSAGTVVGGNVLIISSTHLQIAFSAPFSGTAYLS